jgi:hypothetical protein
VIIEITGFFAFLFQCLPFHSYILRRFLLRFNEPSIAPEARSMYVDQSSP